jgi:hypothetical protein
MKDEYELMGKVMSIVNEYTSSVTGWPLHRVVHTKKGRTRRWRMSYDRYQVWFHKNFIKTDLMRVNLRDWEFKDDGLISLEEYYKDFYKSDYGWTYAIRKEWALKILALGYVAIENIHPNS